MKLSMLLAGLLSVSITSSLRAETVEVGTPAALASTIAADPAAQITLTDNLDMTGWSSVTFEGSLDGAGHTISGLTVPLFTEIKGNASVRNIRFSGASVAANTANVHIGVMAVMMTNGTYVVENISFFGCTLSKKNGGNGGLVAARVETVSGLLSACTADETCTVTAAANSSGTGGFFGTVTANGENASITISKCEYLGEMKLSDYTMAAGGIASGVTAKKKKGTSQLAYVNIYDCTNHAHVSATGQNTRYGGIVHSAEGGTDGINGAIRIKRCVNYGNITLKTPKAGIGGVVGTCKNGGVVLEGCLNYGNVNLTGSTQAAGGLIGSVEAPIRDTILLSGCANRGNVTGNYAGGLIGELSHNSSYKANKLIVKSCFQGGVLSSRQDGVSAGEVVGYLKSAVAYPYVEIAGSMFQSEALVGGMVAGASVSENVLTDNVYGASSEGLVDGTDVATLNAYESCNLWKQGSVGPILKCMPDEAEPDVITIRFVDAEDFSSTVIKTCVVLRGGAPVPPAAPEHDGYTFMGWSPSEFDGLQSDATVVATYLSGTLEHTVRFFDYDGTQIGDSQTVAHGQSAVAPADPVREGYLFTGWGTDFDVVEKDLDVAATYVQLVQDCDTVEELMSALASATHPEVTYRVTADVVWPADWTAIDFCAQLDGAGHTISYLGRRPLFSKLTGGVRNLILDGWIEDPGTSTAITGLDTRFGLLAVSCLGGSISNVTVRNYAFHTSSAVANVTMGLLCGGAGDGAVIEGCTIESNCVFRTRACTIGCIAGFAQMSDSWTGENPSLLAIRSCTNAADIVTFSSGSATLAGILADCSVASAQRTPNVVISNCVNYGKITTAYSGSVDGRFGGIVATRASVQEYGGLLTIVDCANYGDLDAQGNGLNTQSNTGAFYGGILGYVYRLGNTTISRCQNRGKVSDLVGPSGLELKAGNAGGILGHSADMYANRPILLVDSANYGPVNGGGAAGGLIGGASANADYSSVWLTATNCANYARVSVALADGNAGEWIGDFSSSTKCAPTLHYGAWNCFFATTNYVGGADDSLPIVIADCWTPATEGYTATTAKRALSMGAQASDLTPWIVSRVDGVARPELGVFCDRPYQGLRLIVR